LTSERREMLRSAGCRKCKRNVRCHVVFGRACPRRANGKVALNDLFGAFYRTSFSCSLLDGGQPEMTDIPPHHTASKGLVARK